jgi:hypothetical protein
MLANYDGVLIPALLKLTICLNERKEIVQIKGKHNVLFKKNA